MSTAVLEINQLACQYGSQKIVNDVNLALDAGEIGCLLGPSGCGKTTTLRAIAGLEDISGGEILLHGTSASRKGFTLPTEQRQLGMVFQDHALFPHLSVADNIAFGLQHIEKAKRRARVTECLSLVHLSGMEKRMPHELSGGQQQRVALARALAPSPLLILLDEPFASLDLDLRRQLNLELASILRDAGTSTLIVTHDHEQAFTIADKVGVMAEGTLQQWGAPATLHREPNNKRVAEFIGLGTVLDAEQIESNGTEKKVRTVFGESVLTTEFHFDDTVHHVLIRPEQCTLHEVDNNEANATIESLLAQGSTFLCRVVADNGVIISVHADRQQGFHTGQRVRLSGPSGALTPIRN
ncbi:MAG: ABC transporter ATP-binding protein [Alcanivoracaceae bacterium]|nr:ABC transporter ATP-binding protein [Alcanivoracaceae bacterium]